MTRISFIHAAAFAAWIIGSAGAARDAAAQRPAEKIPPFFTRVWDSDSLDVSFPGLSPDGRWIVFGSNAFGRSNLFVIPATGGAPIALTTGAHVDAFPKWFPSGDKIAFESDRIDGVMVLGFDRRTGHAVGTPRRVTLEKAARFAISSGGDRIAYLNETGVGHFTVRLLPATGGPAVTIGEIRSESAPIVLSFSSDDRYVLFTTSDREKGNVAIVRIPVWSGVAGTAIADIHGSSWALPMPARQEVLRIWGRQGAVLAFSGDTTAIFELGDASRLVPAGDGLSAFATTNRVVAPVRVVRRNGDARNVTAGRGYDWPYAWSADAKRVVYSLGDPNRSEGGTWSFEASDLDGKNRRPLRIRPTNLSLGTDTRPKDIAFTSDLRHAAFKIDSMNRPNDYTLVVVDVQTGVARQITSRAERTTVLTGSGNWYATNHGEFVYLERNGGQLDVRAAKPSGESRLLRTLPADARAISVEGDEIAFVRLDGDSTTLFAAHGATGDAKVVARLLGRIDEVVWSPDAKWVAANVYGHDPANKTAGELAIIPVNTSGQPRFISRGNGGYGSVWTRDGSAVFYLRADKAWSQMSVWRYPVRGDAPAENVTKNETSMIWGFVPSPDGSALLIPPERQRGVTLWRVDLQQASAAYRNAKARSKTGEVQSRP